MLTPVRDFVAGVEFCPEKPESAHGLQEILRVEKTLGGPFIPPHGFVFLSTHAVAFGESKPSGDQAHTLRNKWPAEASQNNRRNPRSPEIPPLSFGRVQSYCFASIYGRVRCIRITTCAGFLGMNSIPTGITRRSYNSERCEYTN
jgi:hypothetical protein